MTFAISTVGRNKRRCLREVRRTTLGLVEETLTAEYPGTYFAALSIFSQFVVKTGTFY